MRARFMASSHHHHLREGKRWSWAMCKLPPRTSSPCQLLVTRLSVAQGEEGPLGLSASCAHAQQYELLR